MSTIFKKSRGRIVVATMSILMCLFLGTLAIIYAFSYTEVSTNNYRMLERHAEMYMLSDQPNDKKPGDLPGKGEPAPNDHGGKPFENTPMFRLSTFYSVAVADDGTVLAVDVADSNIYEEETLSAYATDILKGSKTRGTKGSLIFLMTRRNGFSLVTFMDNTLMQESMTTLFRYTLVFGSVAIVALFFLAVYLAGRIVKPLEESYQKQKQFISDAGHELKTPVSVVSANAELLSREIGENQWLANIQYENERMGNLVSQLLELARTENVVPQTEPLDFSRLVAGEALPFESVAFERGLTLRTSIKDHILLNGNSNGLSQLVAILIDNAIRHGQSGKEISVILTEGYGIAILTVINDGEPIPPEKTERLFERFYRADEARNSEDKHYGLGLAIAKAIVTAHHGGIQVTCHNGKVCFTARIPK